MAIYGEGIISSDSLTIKNPTLIHEDIYVYIDPIQNFSETKTGTNINFTNDSINKTADLGIFEVTVTSGSFTRLRITTPFGSVDLNEQLNNGDFLYLDFREIYFVKNGSIVFFSDTFKLGDNEASTIGLTFTGTGSASVKYTHERVTTTDDDLYFCEGLDYSGNFERLSKTNIKNETKNIKGEKKGYTFSINGLWNDKEFEKFTERFNLRLVDDEGKKIETLSEVTINNFQKSSSSNGGDFTYSLSGEFKTII